MSTMIAAVLTMAGPVLAAVFVVGVVALIGLVAYDVVTSRRSEPARAEAREATLSHGDARESAETRVYVERGIARTFVILGGAFWGISLLASAVWYRQGLESMFFVALIPFLLNMAALVLGWRYERAASVMLVLTSAAAVWWGVLSGFEPGVWALFTVLLIGPMMTASVLFWLARRGEIALQLGFAPQMEPVLAEVPRD